MSTLQTYTHILDLPPLHPPHQPTASALLHVLSHFSPAPRTFTTRPPPPRPPPHGFTTYLTRLLASPLAWLPSNQADDIRGTASRLLAALCGRTAVADFVRSFEIQGVTVSIHEPGLTGDGVGGKTWGAAVMLAARLPGAREAGARLLEVGAGTGVVGIVAAALGWEVTVSDLPGVVPNLERNVLANRGVLSAGVEVEVLDWGVLETVKGRRWRVVVAADPIYGAEHPRLLAGVLKETLERSAEARCLVEMPERRGYEVEREEWRVRMVESGLEVHEEGWEVGWDDWDGEEEDEGQRYWWSVWKWKET